LGTDAQTETMRGAPDKKGPPMVNPDRRQLRSSEGRGFLMADANVLPIWRWKACLRSCLEGEVIEPAASDRCSEPELGPSQMLGNNPCSRWGVVIRCLVQMNL